VSLRRQQAARPGSGQWGRGKQSRPPAQFQNPRNGKCIYNAKKINPNPRSNNPGPRAPSPWPHLDWSGLHDLLACVRASSPACSDVGGARSPAGRRRLPIPACGACVYDQCMCNVSCVWCGGVLVFAGDDSRFFVSGNLSNYSHVFFDETPRSS
jgi:hypothetical protein